MKQLAKFPKTRAVWFCALLFAFVLTAPAALAQKTERITGRVTDPSGAPVVGVSVYVEGTTLGATTGVDGTYSLTGALPRTGKSVIVFSCIGFETKRLPMPAGQLLDVTLDEDLRAIDDVVVVGYGVQKKVNLTGSVASIADKELSRRPVMRATTALQGLAAGVTVTQTSGQPGSDGATIRIRGVGTLNNSNPLVLIDGVAGTLDGINPNDIESISVLKDAASAAIYGSRAANGVVLVQTRKGGG